MILATLLKKTGIFLLYGFMCILAFLLLYVGIVFILSRIKIKVKKCDTRNISIFILSNGVHTDIVVPAKNQQKDWTLWVEPEHTLGKKQNLPYLAIGWGDKGFYLDTPTWNDLTFKTAFKAVSGLSTSAMHTTYYKSMKESERCIKIDISETDYQLLVNYIEKSFLLDSNNAVQHIITDANYGKNDAFYEARGKYSFFKTCNSWANDALKSCNQDACLWSAFDKPIFKVYK